MTEQSSSPLSSAAPDNGPENVVALSRYRAWLSRGRRLRRGDQLLDAPNPDRAVQALPPDELYYILQEQGFPEAQSILVHASARQVRTVLDFALWNRDALAPDKLDTWLGAIVEAPDERLYSWLRGIDIELAALIVKKRARVYDRSHGDPPDEAEGVYFETPDGFFTLDLLGDEDASRTTRAMVEAIYRIDLSFGRRFLVGLEAETDAELEETAYRWRSGRMADLGFVDPHEALDVYREVDPASVLIGEGGVARTRPLMDANDEDALRLPTALVERLGDSSPFARAVAGLRTPEEIAETHAALVALSNRVLSADRISPGQDDAIAETLARLQGTLDIALEFLARDVVDAATQAVRSVPLVRLFQVGATLVGKVGKLGRALRRDNPFASVGLALFDAEDDEILDAVARVRPLYPMRLDSPPAHGTRAFASLADIARATAAIERAAASIALLGRLGVRPQDLTTPVWPALGISDPAAVDGGTLARTLLVSGAAPGAPFAALTPDRTHELERRLAPEPTNEGFIATTKAAARARLDEAAAGMGQGAREIARRWLESLSPLGEVLTAPGRASLR